MSSVALAFGVGLLTAAAYRLAAPVGVPPPLADARVLAVAASPPATLAHRADRQRRGPLRSAARPRRLVRRPMVMRSAVTRVGLTPSTPLRVPAVRQPPVHARAFTLGKLPKVPQRSALRRIPPVRHVVQRRHELFPVAVRVASQPTRHVLSSIARAPAAARRPQNAHPRGIVAFGLPRHRDHGRRPHPRRSAAVFEPPVNYNAQPALLTASAEPLQATTALTVTVRPSRH